LHLNEASERRKKKDLCSKEAKLPSLNLSRSEEAEQKENKQDFRERGKLFPKYR